MTDLPASSVVFDRARIERAVEELASAVNVRCAGDEWILVCVMNGAMIFTGELIRRLTFPVRLESVRVSRYHDTTSGGELHWHARLDSEIAGKRFLLADDIFDEGETLAALAAYLAAQGAAEVAAVVLLEKLHDRKVVGFRPDFVGLTCPDVYVFGYGMDYEGRFRNLQEIRRLT